MTDFSQANLRLQACAGLTVGACLSRDLFSDQKIASKLALIKHEVELAQAAIF